MDLRAGIATAIEVPASISSVGHRRLLYRQDMSRLIAGALLLLTVEEDESQRSFWTRCDPESFALTTQGSEVVPKPLWLETRSLSYMLGIRGYSSAMVENSSVMIERRNVGNGRI